LIFKEQFLAIQGYFMYYIENPLMNKYRKEETMAFTNTRGRYASFGVVTSLPDNIIDSFWYIIDNFLKGVFELDELLQFELINNKGKTTFRFSQDSLTTVVTFDFNDTFNPFFPREIFVTDNNGKETIMLPDEYTLI
jgi:hypothetical protein